MRGVLAVALAALAACGGGKKTADPDAACSAAQGAVAAAVVELDTGYVRAAKDTSPAGLCAALADVANSLHADAMALGRMGDDANLDKAAHYLADVQKGLLDHSACMSDPHGVANRLADQGEALQKDLAATCHASVGAK